MQDVGLQFRGQVHQIGRGFLKVELTFLHPIEAEAGGTVIEAVQALHPGSLLRKRDLAQADESDANAASDKSCDEFAGVSPHSAHCVRSHKDMHERSPGSKKTPDRNGRPALAARLF